MVELLRIAPPGLAKAVGFSHGVVVPEGRRCCFVAGQIGCDAAGRVVADDFVAQFEQALANFMAVVVAAGGTGDGIAQMTAFVVDRSEYLARTAELGAVWRRRVGREYPAMALVEVKGLVDPRAKVEIQGVAVL